MSHTPASCTLLRCLCGFEVSTFLSYSVCSMPVIKAASLSLSLQAGWGGPFTLPVQSSNFFMLVFCMATHDEVAYMHSFASPLIKGNILPAGVTFL